MSFFDKPKVPASIDKSNEQKAELDLVGIRRQMEALDGPEEILALCHKLHSEHGSEEEKKLAWDIHWSAFWAAGKNLPKLLWVAREALENISPRFAIAMYLQIFKIGPQFYNPEVYEGYADAVMEETRQGMKGFLEGRMRLGGSPELYIDYLRREVARAASGYHEAQKQILSRVGSPKVSGYRDYAGDTTPRALARDRQVADIDRKLEASYGLIDEISQIEQDPKNWEQFFQTCDSELDTVQEIVDSGEADKLSSEGHLLMLSLDSCIAARRIFLALEHKSREVEALLEDIEKRIERIISLKEKFQALTRKRA